MIFEQINYRVNTDSGRLNIYIFINNNIHVQISPRII